MKDLRGVESRALLTRELSGTLLSLVLVYAGCPPRSFSVLFWVGLLALVVAWVSAVLLVQSVGRPALRWDPGSYEVAESACAQGCYSS